MAEIKNTDAYFGAMVRNSRKDDYRANDNFYKHISSVGDELDMQREVVKQRGEETSDTNSVERSLSELDAVNWLLFMENVQLHKALARLPIADVEFLLELSRFNFNQSVYAKMNSISKQAVSKRFRKLREKILKIL